VYLNDLLVGVLVFGVPITLIIIFVIIFAGWVARRVQREEQAGQKTCPQCAEQVKVAAKVCRFCGYRFDTS
jgi:Uncharacterised protein family UPF0547